MESQPQNPEFRNNPENFHPCGRQENMPACKGHKTSTQTNCIDVVIFQILWTFSIYLESVAILPQLFMVSKTGEAETITSHYLFALGSYRALYLLNWIYRYYFDGFFDLIAVVAGCVQTILYCDFFYLYITKGECI